MEGRQRSSQNSRETEKLYAPGYSANNFLMRVDLPTPDGPDRTMRRESAVGAMVDTLRIDEDDSGVKYLGRGDEACNRLRGLKLGLVNLEIGEKEAPVGRKIKRIYHQHLAPVKDALGTH